jgi:hypothetical protein
MRSVLAFEALHRVCETLMGQVLQLVSEQSVDTAWEAYASKAVQLITEPSLIADRAFNEELARRHARWVKLFLVQERTQ